MSAAPPPPPTPAAIQFTDLSDDTKKFLDELRPSEIEQLKEAIDFMRSVRVVGGFTKWALVSIVSAFIGGVMLYDKIIAIWGSKTP